MGCVSDRCLVSWLDLASVRWLVGGSSDLLPVNSVFVKNLVIGRFSPLSMVK